MILAAIVLVNGSNTNNNINNINIADFKSQLKHLKLNRYLSANNKRNVLKVPIQSKHTQFPLGEQLETDQYKALYPPQIVEVTARSVPLSLIFHSASSDIDLHQIHETIKYPKKSSYSVVEPSSHLLKHSLKKPMYEYVHDYILPYSNMPQDLKPMPQGVQTELSIPKKTPNLYGEPESNYETEQVLLLTTNGINKLDASKESPVVFQQFHPPSPALGDPLIQPTLLLHTTKADQQWKAPTAREPSTIYTPTPIVPLATSAAQTISKKSLVPLTTESLLDTYFKYSKITADDLILPVYHHQNIAPIYSIPISNGVNYVK